MKTIMRDVLLLAAATALSIPSVTAQAPQGGKSADQLRELADQAKHSGDMQSETNYLCQAATLDGKKYGKRCDKAKDDLAKTLAQFQADLGMGRTELQRKDYAGAARDLSKIAFGPSKDEAQPLLQQAHVALSGATPEQTSQLALQAARAAYGKGDFDTAEAQLKLVQTQPLQNAASQLQTNINVYRDTMKQADVLEQAGDYKGALQKFQFAAVIQPNGPGNPQNRVREAQGALARTSPPQASPAPQQAQSAPVTPQHAPAAPPSKVNYAAKIKSSLAQAHQMEQANDLKGAMQGYEAALALDGRQADALAGKKRILLAMKGDPKALEDSLTQAITDFYASHFSQADSGIDNYLQGGGKSHAGAAHFYRGASLYSQAALADPKDQANADTLQKQARDQFAMAKQLHYTPVQTAVSPKILAFWTQTSEQP